ncbi:RepP [Mycoplasma phage MAV1]|uniref:Bacteriophage MAV1 protein RepP n=1 Tax=Metamycoplasma arthritidis (strain 158L3-1) TaxID=243272 RepID=B3PNA6_META1|nr:hypothetical protein [Metamycoplasma arthritidis]NP_047259.1 RepP [Mycoplasma phage MAV1]AAC33769.1 RepP [Mycoplasma phage MAV1]ACF07508.1 bacteriophage MAV1 protein RepP [Metamycoplasma arthritidis 158L3-1]
MDKAFSEYKKVLYSLPKEIKDKLKTIVNCRQWLNREWLHKFSDKDYIHFKIFCISEDPDLYPDIKPSDIVRLENEAKELAFEMNLIDQQQEFICQLCPLVYDWKIKKYGNLCLRRKPTFFEKVVTNDEFNEKLEEFQLIVVQTFERIKYLIDQFPIRKKPNE